MSARQRSAIGLALQLAALAMPLLAAVLVGRPVDGVSGTVRVAAGLGVFVAGLALFAVSACALGAQWSLIARAREGHALVTRGPYGVARHPLYVATGVGLLGAMIAAGDPVTALAAAALYAAGTPLRVRAEEDVLRTAFGTRYDAYARRVPAWGVRAPRRAGMPRGIERADAGATGGAR